MTFEELRSRLELEGFNRANYSIGGGLPALFEGLAVGVRKGDFNLYYVECGKLTLLDSLSSEEECCGRLYDELSKDKWSKAYNVGFFESKSDADALEALLQNERVECYRDAIPYAGQNDMRYRVFVFGADFERAKKLCGK